MRGEATRDHESRGLYGDRHPSSPADVRALPLGFSLDEGGAPVWYVLWMPTRRRGGNNAPSRPDTEPRRVEELGS